MIYLFCIVITFLLGRGALRALYGKNGAQDFTYADSIPVGMILVIGLAEAAHMGAVILGRSFSDCVILFLTGLVMLLIVAGALLVIGIYREKKNKPSGREAERLRVKKALDGDDRKTYNRILFFVFGIVVLIQLLLIVSGQKRYPAGDMTVETVNSMLSTDTIYQVNPMTGQPYTLGIPMRLKILCLPTLYGILCRLFGMSAISVVWTAVPVITLLGSYAAFYTVAKALFREDVRKKGIFMLFVAFILWVGDYMYGMDGFGVQYAGFRGVSIRMAILVPYTFGLVLRRKWKLVVLCIVAEACIVWTLYGMGVCLFIAVSLIVVGVLADKFSKQKIQQGGEEDSE